MKRLVAFLFTSALFYSVPSICAEIDNPSLDPKYSQQLGAINPNNITQQPIFAEEMQIPKPILETSYKSPGLAVGLSVLFPGLGHAYLGEWKTAGALTGSAGAGFAGILYAKKNVQIASLQAFSVASSYGIYSAYRDARINNGASNYKYKMPTDNFVDLSLAPFKLKVLKKPEVWGGFLGAFALAIGTSLLFEQKKSEATVTLASTKEKKMPAYIALPVGISEEALFRGYLQSQLTEIFTPVGGIVLSSMIFGAAHVPTAWGKEPDEKWQYYSFGIPFLTALGAYWGWVTYKNNSLQESVAIHTWYDFVLLTARSVATQAITTGCTRFAIAIPF